MDRGGLDRQLAALALLSERIRRAIYAHVVSSDHPVGRAATAAAVNVPRTVAAFHLDKLVEVGLLDVTEGRTTARRGPGAGRPARLYARSAARLDLTMPPRAYPLLATLLAAAVEDSGADATLHRIAERAGEAVGAAPGSEGDLAAGATSPRQDAESLLADLGYEPRTAGAQIRLGNCPFREVQQEHPVVVCGMNLAFLEGAVRGMGKGLRASMDPRPGECCVTIESIANFS